MTETAQSMPCSIDELRTLFLFEKLTDDQLDWLCREGHVELIPPGRCSPKATPRRASMCSSRALWSCRAGSGPTTSR